MKNVELYEIKKDKLHDKIIALDNGDVILPYHGKTPVNTVKNALKEPKAMIVYSFICSLLFATVFSFLFGAEFGDITYPFSFIMSFFVVFSGCGCLMVLIGKKPVVKPEENYKINPDSNTYHVYGKKLNATYEDARLLIASMPDSYYDNFKSFMKKYDFHNNDDNRILKEYVKICKNYRDQRKNRLLKEYLSPSDALMIENTDDVEQSVLSRVNNVKKEYARLSKVFLDYHTNPEIVITKPLLLDSTNINTEKMIESYNDLKDAMRDLTIIDNLPHFESLISKAHNDFNNADIVANKVGIPGINSNMKSKIKKSMRIVMDDSARKEERIAHWEKIKKIIDNSNLNNEAINKVSNIHTIVKREIETGEKHTMKELVFP